MATALWKRKVRWVLDVDIKSYFDKLSHELLLRFLQHRIVDTRMLRLIQKWLKAGVVENAQWRQSEEGTPRGATVSPLLANVYLHSVFDLWVEHWRKHAATGEVSVVRFADDVVMGFKKGKDARCFLEHLRARMAKFQLELDPDKTGLVRFGRFDGQDCADEGRRKPETISFLGFTHICGRTRSGKYLLMRHTIAKRQRTKLQ